MAKKFTGIVLFFVWSYLIVEHHLCLLRSKPNVGKLFFFPFNLQNLGAGKFQKLSGEMDRVGLKEKVAGSLSQSPFFPGNLLNDGIYLLVATNNIVCEG